jgi:hypothetical protein
MLKFWKQITKVYASCLGWPSGGWYKHQSNINICYSPSLQLPTNNWRSARQLAGPVYENRQPLSTDCLYNTISFPPPSMLRPATSQARLHDVLGRCKSMYETFLLETCRLGLVQGLWHSCLYWYRGETVLLGWVTWKLKWFVHANLPFGRLASVCTTDFHWGRMAQFVY